MSTSDDTSSAELTVQDKLKEALIINRFDSKCGACGKGADPHDDGHQKQLGYGDHPPHGCGIKWRFVTSDYTDMKDGVSAMRPDLEWFERWRYA